MANHLTIAVAGSGKTRSLVEHCTALSGDRRVALLTFTQTNQAELSKRLAKNIGQLSGIAVMGWYTFLLREFARPFLPFLFARQRILGFNFDGRPHLMAKGLRRFLDSDGRVYACELGRLAYELIAKSNGSLLHRLERLFNEILIDEVQDLSGYDWEIIDVLLRSAIEVRMVGDIRQAVLSTNPRGSKNKKYAYAEAIHWFRERESRGTLEISEMSTTWRCHPDIARFSDTIFNADWAFPRTVSMNKIATGHDGVVLVRSHHVSDYIKLFNPRCLRASANSGNTLHLDYLNFGLAKGTSFKRVLIVPTAGILKFVQDGTYLDPIPAAKFYVAVTRAEQSVGIVVDESGESRLPYWKPENVA